MSNPFNHLFTDPKYLEFAEKQPEGFSQDELIKRYLLHYLEAEWFKLRAKQRKPIGFTQKGGAILFHLEVAKHFNPDLDEDGYRKKLEEELSQGWYKIDENGCYLL